MNYKPPQKIWHASALALILLLPFTVSAQTSVIFERTDITIDSPAPPPSSDKDKKDDKPASAPHPTLKFNVESHPEDALRLEFIHTLNTLTPHTGVLITLNDPAMLAVPHMNVYTPVDTLFVADDGHIIQIMPGLVLGEMAQPAKAREPVKSFLFLKDGQTATLGIHPHDIVSGKMFAPAPDVQK